MQDCTFDLHVIVMTCNLHYDVNTIVAPVSVSAPVSVNVDNNGRYRSVTVNAFTITVPYRNWSDFSRYCQRLH